MDGNTVYYTITVTDSSTQLVAAHLHFGPQGENGRYSCIGVGWPISEHRGMASAGPRLAKLNSSGALSLASCAHQTDLHGPPHADARVPLTLAFAHHVRTSRSHCAPLQFPTGGAGTRSMSPRGPTRRPTPQATGNGRRSFGDGAHRFADRASGRPGSSSVVRERRQEAIPTARHSRDEARPAPVVLQP